MIEIIYFKCFGVLEGAESKKLHISVIELHISSVLGFWRVLKLENCIFR